MSYLASLRRTMSDSALLDWLELREAFGFRGQFTQADVRTLWQLTQPAGCRRLQRLEHACLIERVSWRHWRLLTLPLVAQ